MSSNSKRKIFHYTPVAKLLHWAIVLLVIIQFLTAWIMPGIRGDQSPGFLLSIHMSFGLTIIALMLVRLLWRFTHASAPEDDTLPQWQHMLARLTHYALYALLVVVPLLGWAWASSRGWPVEVFGLFTLPPLLADGSSWGRLADLGHAGLAIVLLILIGLHVVAALYHRYILVDDVMESMLPRNISI